jgi:hypothetical protein
VEELEEDAAEENGISDRHNPPTFIPPLTLHAYLDAFDIESTLAAAVEGCGRHVPASEVRAAVRNSLKGMLNPGLRARATGAMRGPSQVDRASQSAVASSFTLADLWEASPIRMDEHGPDTAEILDILFPGDPLLCVGRTSRQFATASKETLRDRLSPMQFVVPSPMSARFGKTKEGKISPHCLDNTGPRRYLVVEFDSGSTDKQAGLLAHLSHYAPFVLAVHSGGKSLHGWFRAHAEESITERFFKYAVSLGADRATWTRSQFVRMPGGLRDGSRRQLVWFLNPALAHEN